MIINGLIGLRLNDTSALFEPFLPAGIEHLELKDLTYRKAILDITVKGKGNAIKSFTLDGKPKVVHVISSELTGRHRVVVEVE